MVLTVNYLGEPDNGAILTGYLSSWLLAGAYLAVGSCMSALARNQVIAFILTVSLCFLFIVSGFPRVIDAFSAWAPPGMIDAVASLSFLIRFEAISKGVIDLRDLLYFLSSAEYPRAAGCPVTAHVHPNTSQRARLPYELNAPSALAILDADTAYVQAVAQHLRQTSQ